MAALVYETIQFSPYVWDGEPALAAQVAAAAGAGFDGIGIDVWSVDRHLATGGTVGEVADALAHHGLPCIELQALAVTTRDETLAEARRLADLAAVLQPQVVMAGFAVEPGAEAVDAFRWACDLVTAHGARVAVEFLPMLPVRDIGTTRGLVARVDAPVGLCVDTWHFFRGPDGWPDLEALPADEIVLVQFDDAPPLESDDLMYETTQRRVLPGEGEFDLERFRDVIRAKGWDGPVGVELISAPLRALGPDEFARRAFTAAAPYWR